jgi:aspartate carbamoyltransferase catalytic subunit
VKKGETLIDTAMTLNAMRADAIVIRHASSGAVRLIAEKVDCPVLNAGTASRAPHPGAARRADHPPCAGPAQGSDLNGLRVTICGDILHSRVARSNILSLTALGCEVSVCAPPR